jgi:DNA-binding transcriptional LysR family regulator
MQTSGFAGFDLNLLVVFEALIVERNVSRAARRVALTQPAVSNALSRLRLLVHDDLFIRTPQEMRPTPRAIELAGPIGDALRQIRFALSPSEAFDPTLTRRHFAIGASDNVDYALAAGFPAFYQIAPHAGFNFLEASGSELAISMLDAGAIDIAVGRFRSLPKRLASASLYTERYVCVARRGHPDLTAGLTLEKFAALPHLAVTRDRAGIVDAALAGYDLARRITVQVPFFALVPHMLEDTDLLAIVGERIGRDFARRANLECHALPLDLQPWEVSAAWVRQANPDDGIGWLLSILKQAANMLTE